MHIVLAGGGLEVTVPIAPGLMTELSVSNYYSFTPSDEVIVSNQPAMIALDGERELPIKSGERVTVRISDAGPIVVGIEKTLVLAAKRSYTCRNLSDEPACA